MGTKPIISIEFSSEAAAGAVLAWVDSNLSKVIEMRMEARSHGDRIFVRNATTEMAGLVAVKHALLGAGIKKFNGHEEQEDTWLPTVK